MWMQGARWSPHNKQGMVMLLSVSALKASETLFRLWSYIVFDITEMTRIKKSRSVRC